MSLRKEGTLKLPLLLWPKGQFSQYEPSHGLPQRHTNHSVSILEFPKDIGSLYFCSSQQLTKTEFCS